MAQQDAVRRVIGQPPPAFRQMWRGQGVMALVAALMMADLSLIFFWVPTDVNLGIVQRVFYFHVPVAWVSFLAFFIVFVASVGYLWKRNQAWDALAHSAAEIGVLLASLMLITGVIWAKPIWGVWWTWDPRLTTSLILWLIYVAYLMVRAYAASPGQAARYSAVVGIFGFIDVPIVYFSIVWWRTIHPQPMVTTQSLEPEMFFTLLFSVATFTLLFALLLAQRFTLRRVQDSLEEVQRLTRRS